MAVLTLDGDGLIHGDTNAHGECRPKRDEQLISMCCFSWRLSGGSGGGGRTRDVSHESHLLWTDRQGAPGGARGSGHHRRPAEGRTQGVPQARQRPSGKLFRVLERPHV